MKVHFPLLENDKELVYLDSAATTQKPFAVIDAMRFYLQEACGTVHRAVYSLAAEATRHMHAIRQQTASFIGANSSEEIIFTRGATQGINLVAFSFGELFVHEGDEILICETEHHANIVPWQQLCQRKKAHLRIIPVNDQGMIDLVQLQMMFSSRVKLIAIAWLANATGVIHPVYDVIRMAHARGIVVLVDAAQMVAHRLLCVAELDADFVVFSAHKMYGPTALGILYGKSKWLEAMIPYETGGDMIEEVSFTKTTFQNPPLRFEAGTPSIGEIFGFGAAMTFLQEIGMAALAYHEEELSAYAVEKMRAVFDLAFLVPPQSSIISFTCQGCHPLDLGALLDSKKVCVRTGHLCAQPALRRFGKSSVMRLSLGMYNSKEDIDRFITALCEGIDFLRR